MTFTLHFLVGCDVTIHIFSQSEMKFENIMLPEYILKISNYSFAGGWFD